MAYNNNWYGLAPYLPSYQTTNPYGVPVQPNVVAPVQNQPQMQPYPQSQPQKIFDWVPSKEAADMYALPPNSVAALMDSNQPIIYMKKTDQTGKPTPTEVQYLVSQEDYQKLQTPEEAPNYVTKEELDSALDRMRSQMNKKEAKNGKSNV